MSHRRGPKGCCNSPMAISPQSSDGTKHARLQGVHAPFSVAVARLDRGPKQQNLPDVRVAPILVVCQHCYLHRWEPEAALFVRKTCLSFWCAWW